MHFTGSTLVANNRVETPSNAEQVPPSFSIPDSSETEITSKCFALDLLVMPHSLLLLFGLCLTAGAGTATAERFLYHRVVWRRSGFLPV